MADVRLYQIVIDCSDPRGLAEFWSRFTGHEVKRSFEDWATIESRDGGSRIRFQRVPECKVAKNRVHIDFMAKDEEASAKEIEVMGATRR